MKAACDSQTCSATAPETGKALPVLSVSTLPVSSVSALSVFPQIPDSVMVPCLVHGPTPVRWSPVPSAPPWGAPVPSAPPWGAQSRLLRLGGLQSRLLRPGGLQSRLLRLGGLQVRLLHPGGSQSRLLRLGGLQVRLLHPGGSQSRLLRPGGLQVRLLRPGGLQCHPLRLGFHMDLALRPSPCSASAPPPTMDCLGASGSRSLGGAMSQIQAMNFAPLTHHMDFHTTQSVTDHSRTTFPIIHCTNTAVCTDHAHTCKQSPQSPSPNHTHTHTT